MVLFALVDKTVGAQNVADSTSFKVQINAFLDNQPSDAIEIMINGRRVNLQNGFASMISEADQAELQAAYGEHTQSKIFAIHAHIPTQVIVDAYSQKGIRIDVRENANVSGGDAELGSVEQKYSLKFVEEGSQKAIQGLKVFISGDNLDLETDGSGAISFATKFKRFNVSTFHRNYESLNLVSENIKFSMSGKAQQATFAVADKSLELEEYVAVAPKLTGSQVAALDQKFNNTKVSDVISLEQMKKGGDSNVASTLRRATGLTILGGKYLYIRGMGERYSSTTVNGAIIPSTNPLRKVVSLDLFPTGFIDSISIDKAYSPELPGDFGGGNVNINTKSLTHKAFTKLSLGMKIIPSDTGATGYTYAGTEKDYTTYDGGDREMPAEVAAIIKSGRKIQTQTDANPTGQSPGELQALGKSFRFDYAVKEKKLPPGGSLSVTHGQPLYRTGLTELSMIFSGKYSNEYSNEESARASYNLVKAGSKELVTNNNYNYRSTDNNIELNGIFSLGGSFFDKGLDLVYNHMFFRNSESSVEQFQGFYGDQQTQIRNTQLKWTERSLISNQYLAKYNFKALNDSFIKLNYSNSNTRRYQPDTREYRYEEQNGVFRYLASRNDGNTRIFSDLNDHTEDFHADVQYNFDMVGTEKDGNLKIGYQRFDRNRFSDTYRLTFRNVGAAASNPELLEKDIESILNEDNIAPDLFELRDQTLNTDSYIATQTMTGQYFNLQVPVANLMTLSGGVRKETSDQKVTTFDPFAKVQEPIEAKLETSDALPSYAIVFHFGKKINLKLNYSKTLSRPEFKELSTALFYDDESGLKIKGNENLKTARITNYDARIEYLHSFDEYFSIAYFRKEFTDPIEVFVPTGTDSDLVSFTNSEGATNLGFELEARKRLNFIPKFMKNIYLAGNYARIMSEVRLGESQKTNSTSKSRPLQGQSPYTTNVQLEYLNPLKTLEFNILYNVIGERITSTGTSGLPDVIELPYHHVDIVSRYAFTEDTKAEFKLKNLLARQRKFEQGEQLSKIVKTSQEYSLGISSTF